MLARLVRESTADLEDYNYARVLERTETFFWSFCDDYLELVKWRRYGDQGAELAALRQRRAADGALGDAAAVRAVPAVRDRGSLVVVAGRLDPPAPWPTAEEVLAPCGGGRGRARRRGAAVRRRRARRDPQEEVRGAAAAEDAGHAGRRPRARRGCWRCCPTSKRDLRASRADPASSRRRRPTRCRSRWSSRRRSRPGRSARMRVGPVRAARSGALSRDRAPRARRRSRLGRRDDRGDRRRRRCAARGVILAKCACVIAGLDVAAEAFRQLDPGRDLHAAASTTAIGASPATSSRRCAARRRRC